MLCYFLWNFSSPSKFLTSVFALGTLHEFCKSFTEMETVPNLGPFIWLQQIPLSSSFTEVNYFATRVNFQQRKAVKIVNSLAFRKRLLFCQCHLYWCLRPSKMTMTIKNACIVQKVTIISGPEKSYVWFLCHHLVVVGYWTSEWERRSRESLLVRTEKVWECFPFWSWMRKSWPHSERNIMATRLKVRSWDRPHTFKVLDISFGLQ